LIFCRITGKRIKFFCGQYSTFACNTNYRIVKHDKITISNGKLWLLLICSLIFGHFYVFVPRFDCFVDPDKSKSQSSYHADSNRLRIIPALLRIKKDFSWLVFHNVVAYILTIDKVYVDTAIFGTKSSGVR